MTIVIFAGGAGTRLWPLSRKNSPKQFAKLVGERSTLQLAADRVKEFGVENIFVSTNASYVPFIKEQIPSLAESHIFSEPDKRDLAAAVCLTLTRLKKHGVSGPISIIWSDHLVERPDIFVNALEKAHAHVLEHHDQFVFIGETPRFANHNLGWIHVGEDAGNSMHRFVEWKYRPDVETCNTMFGSGEWVWNPGYFTFDIDFCLSLYEKFQPEMIQKIRAMVEDDVLLEEEYKHIDALSFDEAIVEKLSAEQAVVQKVDMGWSDPGTLYALKEAMTKSEDENYVKGKVVDIESRDSFIYNEEDEKVLTTIGLEGVCVVNTKDATLVCKKEDVPRIKELLATMKDENLDAYL